MTPTQARANRTAVIVGRIEELTSFYSRIEKWLAREVETLKKRSKRHARLPPEKLSKIEQLDSNDQFMLKTVFTKMLRYSVLVTSHTLLEASLDEICSAEEKRYGHRLGLKHLAGSGIARARLYLTKVCGVAFPDATAEWNRMEVLNDLRNLIAHADGDVSRWGREQRMRDIVNHNSGLNLRQGKYLEVTDGFVQDTLSKMNRFFFQLHRAFPPKVRMT